MINVIYEDKNLVALNKPAGGNFDWVLSEHQNFLPVHRLDKETSGVIIFAKNKDSQDHIKKLFKDRAIEKSYQALVVGVMRQSSGTIDLPIGRSATNPLKRVATGKQRGVLRESRTDFEVLKRFSDFTLLRVMPKTGRTHQIRAHFSAIHHPVVCDRLYAGKHFVCPGGILRQFLHAESIEFDGLRLEADLPKDLKKTLDMLT